MSTASNSRPFAWRTPSTTTRLSRSGSSPYTAPGTDSATAAPSSSRRASGTSTASRPSSSAAASFAARSARVRASRPGSVRMRHGSTPVSRTERGSWSPGPSAARTSVVDAMISAGVR